MNNWAIRAEQEIRAHGACVLVSVASVEGSAPRETGARMVVSDSACFGTIGGGNLEFQATAQARALLSKGQRTAVLQDYPLGPFLGQCCGGHVRLLLECLNTTDLDWLANLGPALAGEALFTRTVLLGTPGTVQIEPAEAASNSGPVAHFRDSAGSPLQGARPPRQTCATFEESIEGAGPPVWLFGAGHVGLAAATALHPLPIRLAVFDSRAAHQGPITPYRIEVRAFDAEFPAEIVAQAPPQTRFLIMTHAHDLDYELVRAALLRGDVGMCGLIGSATKRARFLSRLKADGLTQAARNWLTCPIGAAGLASKAPEIIAIGIASDIARSLEPAPPPITDGARDRKQA